ncbi:S8 family peptidase [Dyadobacter fanqingshengii]|uniref:S8 family peptidase n=1 Tax=Dyadobacter fanqingshengii TaxID=2906443 RepID=A0A9X1P6Y9_9BACT|nr:S8 family peptidase [Dyadobacter fanqingshengii]MCF0039491.1 S8 family peptidase [Dyadobacter fanqingshengii]USJ33700.1 S8 family peptidase [Dyadobacter fanqingshengii]
MIRTILSTLTATFLCLNLCFAQSNPRYFVLFKDKNKSTFSVDKPAEFLSARAIARRTRQNISITTHDFPVNPGYVFAIKQLGASVIFTSRWFNGAVVEATAAQLANIKKLPFYKSIEFDLPVANIIGKSPGVERIAAKLEAEEDLNYGNMNAQLALMDVPQLHTKGFHGENMLIAILDNGFLNADQVGFLKPLRDAKKIVDTYDFMGRETNVFNDGSHGLHVMSTMAANQPGSMIGAAFEANYALYRTENDFLESPYEEITWLMAAERADSVGADVINSSLGYSEFDAEFDKPEYNYTYQDLDGKTTIVSRAARYATRTGMLVVCSAGNEGNKVWRYVTAPADVDSVLTVGATNYERVYTALSSVGPNAAGQQKPDVAAVGLGSVIGNASGNVASSNGTSFSSPLIAGFATILWQAYPNLSAQQLINVIKKSGHQASAPDNMLGYGVPSAVKAEQIIQEDYTPLGTEGDLLKEIVLSPNPVLDNASLTIPPHLIGKKATLSLYGLNGAALSVSEARLTSVQSIAANQLSAGLYLVKIRIDSHEKALKFIKQ